MNIVKIMTIITFLAFIFSTVFVYTADASLTPSSGWAYYKQLNISDSAGVSADYQMRLTIYAGSGTDDPANGTIYCDNHCSNFPNDIRFGTTNDLSTATQLAQWIEESNATSATIWVKCPSDGSNTFYMFVGNSGASEYSSGDDTFIFFDDFEDNSIDTSKWDILELGTGSISEENNKLKFSCPATDDIAGLVSKVTYNISNTIGRVFLDENLELGECEFYYGLTKTTTSNPFLENNWVRAVVYHGWSIVSNDYTAQKKVNGTKTTLYQSAWLSEAEVVKLAHDGSNFHWYEQDTERASETYPLSSTNVYIYIYGAAGGDASFTGVGYADTFFLRKYASTEPSWSSFGSWTSTSANNEPSLSISLSDNQTVDIEQDLNIIISDADGDTMDIVVKVDNQTYTTFENVTNGTYKVRLYFKNYNYSYNVNVSVTDDYATNYSSATVTTNTTYKAGLSKEEADNLFLSSALSLSSNLLYLTVAFALIVVSFQSKRVVLASVGTMGATFIFLYLLYLTLDILYFICMMVSFTFFLYFAFSLLGGHKYE